MLGLGQRSPTAHVAFPHVTGKETEALGGEEASQETVIRSPLSLCVNSATDLDIFLCVAVHLGLKSRGVERVCVLGGGGDGGGRD